jgi:hypothetical protein
MRAQASASHLRCSRRRALHGVKLWARCLAGACDHNHMLPASSSLTAVEGGHAGLHLYLGPLGTRITSTLISIVQD